MLRFVTARVTAAGLLLAGLGGVTGRGAWAAAVGANADGTPNYAQERTERAKDLTTPYGWFSLIALEWLKPGVTTVGSAKDNTVVVAGVPAHLVRLEQGDGVVRVASADPSVQYGGKVVTAGATVSEDESDGASLASGTVRMWAIKRGDRRYLRVKDANAPALVGFHGLRWYAPDARMRVTAQWVPYASPHTMHFMNKLGQVSDVQEPGYVEFTMAGKTVRMTPLTASDKDGLWFVFRDETFRVDTDGGGRFLTTGAPSHGLGRPGTVVLDFNQAENPPCAYSPYATCPLAAPENRLAVAVRAGEKRYGE